MIRSSGAHRLFAALLTATIALLVADLAGSPVTTAVRSGAALVVGPVQRALSSAPPDELARLDRERTRLAGLLATAHDELAELRDVRSLLAAEPAVSREVVAARVVATGLNPTGGRSVTLDVGSRDGITGDSTVVAAAGLVGRVVSVSSWTCEVQVLGTAGGVVGVRVGLGGRLATVGPPTASQTTVRPRGSLSLTFVEPGNPAVGDVVRTLGSVDERPYVAGVLVGMVTSVDPDSGAATGQVTRTATVRPAVDADTLDVVAVLLPKPRRMPRPATTSNEPATPTVTP